MIYLLAAAVLLSIAVIVAGISIWRRGRRHALLRRLLDDADALEALLHRTRSRMAEMKQVVERVAPDIGAAANASLDADLPVQQGLRHVLEHRLWIARNVETASLDQLASAVAAMERSNRHISERLSQLELTGAELADATRDTLEMQAREPAALKRGDAVDGSGKRG